MSTKTQRAAFAATALTLIVTLANAEGSGAFAQQASDIVAAAHMQEPLDAAETAPPQPRFISREVVQPLPAADTDGADFAAEAETLHALVSSLQPATMSADMMCLAQAVYFESRGEPLSGQLAVGRVVVNRAADPAFPGDYCSVVKQRGQFSFVKNGRIPNPRTGSAAWQRAQAVARIAHEELWDSEADDALFFHATHVSPRWARAKITRARIDSHIFYR